MSRPRRHTPPLPRPLPRCSHQVTEHPTPIAQGHQQSYQFFVPISHTVAWSCSQLEFKLCWGQGTQERGLFKQKGGETVVEVRETPVSLAGDLEATVSTRAQVFNANEQQWELLKVLVKCDRCSPERWKEEGRQILSEQRCLQLFRLQVKSQSLQVFNQIIILTQQQPVILLTTGVIVTILDWSRTYIMESYSLWYNRSI